MDFEEKKPEVHNINIYLLVLFLYPPEISLDGGRPIEVHKCMYLDCTHGLFIT